MMYNGKAPSFACSSSSQFPFLQFAFPGQSLLLVYCLSSRDISCISISKWIYISPFLNVFIVFFHCFFHLTVYHRDLFISIYIASSVNFFFLKNVTERKTKDRNWTLIRKLKRQLRVFLMVVGVLSTRLSCLVKRKSLSTDVRNCKTLQFN